MIRIGQLICILFALLPSPALAQFPSVIDELAIPGVSVNQTIGGPQVCVLPGTCKPVPVALPHVVDIKNFGGAGSVKCDSRTDDTTAIQAAINYVHNNFGGGVAYLPVQGGNCCVRGGITIPSSVVLRGAAQGLSLFSSCGADVTPVNAISSGFTGFEYLTINGKDADGSYSSVKITGTIIAGQQVSIQLASPSCSGCSVITGTPITVSYTEVLNDTLATVAAGLATAINNNTNLVNSGLAGFSSSYSTGTFVEIFRPQSMSLVLTTTSSANTTLTDWSFGSNLYPALDMTNCAECWGTQLVVSGGNYAIHGPVDSLVSGSHFGAGYLGLGYVDAGSWWVRNSFDGSMPLLPAAGVVASPIPAWQSAHTYNCSASVPCFVSLVPPSGPLSGLTMIMESCGTATGCGGASASGISGASQPKLQPAGVPIVDGAAWNGAGGGGMVWKFFAYQNAANIIMTSAAAQPDTEHLMIHGDAGGLPYCLVINDSGAGGVGPSHVRYRDSFCTGTMNNGVLIKAGSDIEISSILTGGGWLGANQGDGFLIAPSGAQVVSGVRIHDNNIASGACGVDVGPSGGGTAENISINNNNIWSTTIAAVCVQGNATRVNVVDNLVGGINGTVGSANARPFELIGTADYVSIFGNQTQGATSGPLITSTGTHNSVHDNPGYNPVGVSQSTAGTSPYTFPTSAALVPSPATLYIIPGAGGSAADLTDASVGGNSACKSMPCALQLGPNEQAVLTWATHAPLITQSVH